MTEIFPAEGQLISEIMNELREMGFVDGRDYRLHYTWDARPHIRTTPETYEKWAEKQGEGKADKASSTEPDDPQEDPDAERETEETDRSGSGGNARRTGKQRR